MFCRTKEGNEAAKRLDVDETECAGLICNPCGREFGGCNDHPEPIVWNMAPVYAGYHVEQTEWGMTKGKVLGSSSNIKGQFMKLRKDEIAYERAEQKSRNEKSERDKEGKTKESEDADAEDRAKRRKQEEDNEERIMREKEEDKQEKRVLAEARKQRASERTFQSYVDRWNNDLIKDGEESMW